MEYPTSSQRLRWLFPSQEALDAEREKARQRVLLEQTTTADVVTLEEEKQLVSYYAQKLIELAKTMKLPDKVVSSACTYLQRFYIRNSCLEYDPQGIVLTCLYIAAKVEDWYISAEHIHTVGGIPEDVILKSELPLLQGLGFDLQVHPIHKALDGFLAMREEDATLRDKAAKIVEGFLLTDAIMLFTPGQLALKAIGSTLPDIDEASMKDERLVEILLQIDKYVDTKRMEDVKMIDRKLKLFLKGQKKRKRKQEET